MPPMRSTMATESATVTSGGICTLTCRNPAIMPGTPPAAIRTYHLPTDSPDEAFFWAREVYVRQGPSPEAPVELLTPKTLLEGGGPLFCSSADTDGLGHAANRRVLNRGEHKILGSPVWTTLEVCLRS